jgi:putative iron-only hydrogenase system regulator
MEKRIGSILILVSDKSAAPTLNRIISDYADIIIARQGLPTHSTGEAIISLIVEGDTDQIGALSGKLGRLQGLSVKTAILKMKKSQQNEI